MSKVADAFDRGGRASQSIAQTLGFAKQTAVSAIATAEDQHFTVHDNGAVTYTKEASAWLINEYDLSWVIADSIIRKLARQHETDIQKALRDAGDAAAQACQAIDGAFAEVPVPTGAELERIMKTYQAQADPDGMVKWPDGVQAKILGLVGEPMSITVAEAQMLDNLSVGDKIRFWVLKEKAEDAAGELYPGHDQDNQADAFRHTYWNALMTKEFGEDWTREYTTKHEGRPDNASVREAMDLYNNEVGRNIALTHSKASDDELQDLAKDAVNNGKTVMVSRDLQLQWTNTTELGTRETSLKLDEHPTFLPGSPVPDNRPSPK